MKLLVIDDSPTVRLQIQKHFKALGHDVYTASGGEDGLKAAISEEFDIIILDYSMPDMDGIEVLQRIRIHGIGAAVVMLTASDSASVAVRALKDGALDYVTKPYNLNDLTAVVEKVLREHRSKNIEESLEQALKAMAGEQDLEKITQTALTAVTRTLGYRWGVMFIADMRKHCLTARGMTADSNDLWDMEPVSLSRQEDYRVQALFDQAAIILEDPEEFRNARLELVERFKIKAGSVAWIPISAKGKTVGIMEVGRSRGEPPVPAPEMNRLTGFINRAGVSIAGAQRVSSIIKAHHDHRMELNMASKVQKSLLPRSYNGSKIRIQALQNPAKVVCGDFYNFYPIGDDRVDFFIGDVVGKGMQASILMGHIMALFNQFRHLDAPAQILESVNRHLMDNVHNEAEPFFGTTFYAVFQSDTGVLTYSTAGHPLPFLCRDGKIITDALSADGMGFGILPVLEAEDHVLNVQHGDTLILFTDGVTEAMNSSNELYERKRLRPAVEEALKLPSEQTLEFIMNDIEKFSASIEDNDDITLIAVRFL